MFLCDAFVWIICGHSEFIVKFLSLHSGVVSDSEHHSVSSLTLDKYKLMFDSYFLINAKKNVT